MSKFITTIAVDVEAVRRLLPKRASVLQVRFDAVASWVEVIWDDDDLETGYTFPVVFDRESLEARRLPKGVRNRARRRDAGRDACDTADSEVCATSPEGSVPTGSAVRVAGGKGRRGK